MSRARLDVLRDRRTEAKVGVKGRSRFESNVRREARFPQVEQDPRQYDTGESVRPRSICLHFLAQTAEVKWRTYAVLIEVIPSRLTFCHTV